MYPRNSMTKNDIRSKNQVFNKYTCINKNKMSHIFWNLISIQD